MTRFAWAVTVALFSAQAFATPTPRPLVTQPELEWARSYLLHQILLTEYVSYASAPAKSERERTKRLQSPQAVALWKRARFAVNAARAANQDLGETTAARALLLEHMAVVKRQNKKTFAAMQAFEAETDPARQRVEAATTFGEDGPRAFLMSASNEAPACTPSPVFTPALLAKTAEADPTRLGPVLESLRGAQAEDVRCAVVTWLRTGRDEERLAARVVVEASTHVPELSQDVTLALLKATLLLASQDYAEALRILFDQQTREAAYRAPYDLVQVIFSRRQHGDGSVHIKGL